MTSAVIDDYRRAFDALPQPGHAEAELAAERRRTAFTAFAELGFPTRRDEDWRYTSTAPMAKRAFLPRSGSRGQAHPLLAQTTLPDEVARIVFIDGTFSYELSRLEPLPEGLSFAPVSKADADELDELAGSAEPKDGLDALADAFAIDGAVVRFARDTETPGVVHLVHLSSNLEGGSLAATRSFLIAEPRARGHVLETYVGAAPALRLPRTVVSVGAGALIRHERVQLEAEDAFHIGRQLVTVGRDADYRGFNFTLGAALSRDALQVRLLEPGANVGVAALYAPRRRQTFDNHTAIEHVAPSCTSEQLYRGIIDGAGHGVFNGRIVVHPHAQKAAAEQLNQNLLLTAAARIDTKPQLEVFADDVRCTHGATVGQISTTELFYMMSRAIPEALARQMLIFGFAEHVLRRVADSTVRDQMTKLLRQAFAA